MNDPVGFIGDIHGDYEKLSRLVEVALKRLDHLVFLGDYVNRGPHSKRVIGLLLELQRDSSIRADFCQGNHDAAFLKAIDGQGLAPFLRMGGAATLSSYIQKPGRDLVADIRGAVPQRHIDFLRSLEQSVIGPDFIATHDPVDAPAATSDSAGAFRVYGHRPQEGLIPTVTDNEAWIDTGAGTLDNGRLTCFLLPDRSWIQVDEAINVLGPTVDTH